MCYKERMKKLDGRKLDHKTREQIRIRAVKLVEAGESPEQVIKALGFHRSCIYNWIAKYREGGVVALKRRKITGRPPKLNSKHLKRLYDVITSKNPLQLKFKFALWTREMIRDLIRDEFNVRLSVVSVGRLLRKLGMSPQKPLRRAYQQDKKRVEQWLKEEYPLIKVMAKRHKAAIFFGDEASIRSDFHSGTSWAPKGQTPIIETTGARFNVNMISAVNNKGLMRFMTFEGRLNSDKFIEFLRRLIHNVDHPIYLIVDGHPTHKSTRVSQFVDSTKGKLKVFYLPPYSPELNPDELVWNHVKSHRIGKTMITGPDDLKAKVISCLRSLQKYPKKIMGFFKEPHVRYALA
jgi:transposase